MEQETLKILIFIALCILVLLWGTIAYSLLYRKLRKRKLLKIEETFADILSKHLYISSEETSFIHIQRVFRKLGIDEEHPANVQFLIDLMIRTQRSLLGRNHTRLQQLYAQIPPYRASYKKTLSKKWHLQARGIREIYEMNQPQYTNYVARFRDHPNLFVRREAQIALVVFLGWESLRFLPYLSRKLELWQQIKIVEKLHDLYPEPRVEYIQNAYKIKNDFGREVVMRVIRKYRLQEESNYIISNLFHSSFEVRETAIYCLSSFTLDQEQLQKVKELFPNLENLQQQKQVLSLIEKSSSVDDVPFYLNLLNTSHEMLKLKVAEILWNNGHMEEVQQFYLDQYKSTSELKETTPEPNESVSV